MAPTNQFERTLVLGTSGSGKTHFARRLGATLRLPHVELDQIYWLPDWKGRPDGEFLALVAREAAADRWVIDGNYSRVQGALFARATTVVWLNYSFSTVFGRGLRRTLTRAIGQEPLFAGNRESFARAFLSKESILWWILSTYHRRRRKYRRLFDDARGDGPVMIELRRPADAEALLGRLAGTANR